LQDWFQKESAHFKTLISSGKEIISDLVRLDVAKLAYISVARREGVVCS